LTGKFKRHCGMHAYSLNLFISMCKPRQRQNVAIM